MASQTPPSRLFTQPFIQAHKHKKSASLAFAQRASNAENVCILWRNHAQGFRCNYHYCSWTPQTVQKSWEHLNIQSTFWRWNSTHFKASIWLIWFCQPHIDKLGHGINVLSWILKDPTRRKISREGCWFVTDQASNIICAICQYSNEKYQRLFIDMPYAFNHALYDKSCSGNYPIFYSRTKLNNAPITGGLTRFWNFRYNDNTDETALSL